MLDIRALFLKNPEVGFLTDSAGVIQAATAGAERALGYGPGEFAGLELARLDEGEGMRSLLARPVTSRWALDLVLRLRAKEGRVFTARAVAAPLIGESGERQGWMVWAQDLLEALEQSRGIQTVLDAVVDSIGAALWSFDAGGVVLTWGPACESLFGYARAEAEGKLQAAGLFPSPDEYRRVVREVDERGRFSGEAALAGRGGQVRPCQLVVTRLASPAEGPPLGYTAVSFDLSERKREEEFQRILFEQAGEAMVVVDMESGRIVDCNAKMCEIHGYGRDEMLRLSIADLKAGGDMIRLRDTMGRTLLETGRYVNENVIHRRKDGSIFPCEVNVRLVAAGGRGFTIGIIRDLTEKHRAAEFFRVLFEKSADGAYLVEDEGLRVVEVNEAICRLLGYTRKEMLALTVREITPPEHRHRIEEVRHGVKIERPFERVRRYLWHKEGREVLTDHMISRMEYGGRIYYLASARDVTDLVRTERELEESRALLEKFRDEAPDPMYVLDGEGRLRYLNASACRMLGGPAERFVGRSFMEMTPPDRAALHRDMFVRAMRGETVRFRTEVLGTDGARIPIEINGAGLMVGGRPGTMGVARPIADQIRLERELEEAKSFLEYLQESAADGIVLTDDKGVILTANRRAAELRGVGREDLIGRPFVDYSMAGEAERFKAEFGRLQAGEPVRIRTRVGTDAGCERILDVNAASLERGGKRYVFAILRDMTEQVRAEEALRKSEARYRALIEVNDTGFVVIDPEGWVVDANAEYVRLTGHRELDEIRGRNVVEWTAPHERKRNAEAVRECFRKGRVRNLEIEYADSAGHTTPIEISATVVSAGGTPLILSLCRDMTERKKVEGQLRQEVAERRRAEEDLKLYREVLAHSNDAFIIVDPQTVILEQNDAHRKLLGYSDDELVGKTPAVFARNYQANMEIVRSQGWLRREIVNITREGKDLSVEMSLFPVYGEAGEVRCYVAIKRDVTERKQAEERLREEVAERRRAEAAARESEEKWQQLVASAPDMIVTFDRQGKILFINRTEPGYEAKDVLGATILDFVLPEYHPMVKEKLARFFETGEFQSLEIRGLGAHRAVVWYSVRVSAVRSREGGITALGIVSDITERKRVQEQVAALAEELSLLLATTRDFVYRHDSKGVFTYVSPSVEQISGRPMREWMTHYSEILTDSLLNRRAIEYTEETLKTGLQSPPYLVEVSHRDGRRILLEVNERAYWEGGKVAGIVGVARDVTERKRAEGRTAAQHAVTRVLAESASLQEALPRMLQALGECLGWQAGAFWRMDTEAGVLRCERFWHEPSFHAGEAEAELEKRALRPGEWLPGRVWAGKAPLWIPDMAGEGEGTLAAGAGLRAAFAFPIQGTEGILGVIELLHREAQGRDPDLLGLAESLGSQISQFIERKRAEEALRFQKALLESQSEAAIDGILVISTAGKVVSHNRRLLTMWDLPPELLARQSDEEVRQVILRQLVDPEAFTRRIRYIDEHSDQESRDEVPLKDGRTFERYIAPVRSLDGVNYGRVLFFRDVTGRKRAEEGLRRAVEDARRAYDDLKQAQAQLIRSEKLASIGMLVSGVAHEINNPLNVIYGNLRLLEEGWGGLGAAVGGAGLRRMKRMVRDALKGADHARRIIEDFRNFARDTRTAEAVDLNQGLEETLTLFGRQLPPGVSVVKRFGKIPPVRCFRGQINQVFLNLIKNAAEAIEGEGRITLRTRRGKGRVVIEVADTGRGIPAGVRKKIFEPFFTTKPVGKGLGLGLSISATIVHNHRGEISVQSRPGRGTVFRVELPIKS